MHFFKTLLAGAAVAVTAVAAQGRLQFTSFTPNVEVGEPVTVTWAGGADAPVTITLRKGLSTNLEDVAVLTTAGTGGSYTWIPDTTLPDGEDYALQISQGEDVNYTAQFSVTGGSPEEYPTTATTVPATTATTATTTGVTTDSGSSSATPSGSTSATPSSSSSSTLVTTKTMTATPSGDSSSTPTASGSPTYSESAPAATQTGGAASMASPLALVLGIVAAVAYLN